MTTFNDLDVDALWERMARTVRGLQGAARLPADDGDLYDPHLYLVRHALYERNPGRASQAARLLVGVNRGAAFLAFELIKEYYLAIGDLGRAGEAARAASRRLLECQKAEAKRRKKRGY